MTLIKKNPLNIEYYEASIPLEALFELKYQEQGHIYSKWRTCLAYLTTQIITMTKIHNVLLLLVSL